jgi:hypothetical protein
VDSALSAIVDVLDAAQELDIDTRQRSALRGNNKSIHGNSAPQ